MTGNRDDDNEFLWRDSKLSRIDVTLSAVELKIHQLRYFHIIFYGEIINISFENSTFEIHLKEITKGTTESKFLQ